MDAWKVVQGIESGLGWNAAPCSIAHMFQQSVQREGAGVRLPLARFNWGEPPWQCVAKERWQEHALQHIEPLDNPIQIGIFYIYIYIYLDLFTPHKKYVIQKLVAKLILKGACMLHANTVTVF